MKKYFFVFLLIIFLLPAISIAQTNAATNFVALAPIPGLTEGQPQNDLPAFLNNLYKFTIGLAAVIAVIQIIRGGLLIATQDSISKHGEGRALIEQAVFGLLLILSPVLVFSLINPAILNLEYNLDPIPLVPAQTFSKPPTQTGFNGTNTYTVKGTITKCSAADCSKEKTACYATGAQFPAYTVVADVVCVDSSGSAFAPLVSGWLSYTYSCSSSGQSPSVDCHYTQTGIQGK